METNKKPIFDMQPDLPHFERDFLICSKEDVDSVKDRSELKGMNLDIIVHEFCPNDRMLIGSKKELNIALYGKAFSIFG